MLYWFMGLAWFGCRNTTKEVIDGVNQQDRIVDADGDGFDNTEDCNDENASIFPNAVEDCDGIDNDCDNQIDEDVSANFYADGDEDGFGNPNIMVSACSPPAGYVENGSDCNDTDARAYPGGEEVCDGLDNDCNGQIDEDQLIVLYLDEDGDGFGDEDKQVEACQPELGMVQVAGDCNDNDAGISPFAVEICDDIDNNCDGQTDEGLMETYYLDADNDGYGNPNSFLSSCVDVEGHVRNMDDCDDTESTAYPGMPEYCDGIDNDCDGTIDGPTSIDAQIFYADVDGDSFGDPDMATTACEAPANSSTIGGDCNDGNSNIHPSMLEVCDGLDNDCDGTTDGPNSSGQTIYYTDADGDGFGDSSSGQSSCTQPAGTSPLDGDCDDSLATVHPSMPELCDGVDNNCDGTIDDANSYDAGQWYLDNDNDGYGDPDTMLQSCTQPADHVENDQDCDDNDSTISPENIWYPDADGDGVGSTADSLQACEQPTDYVAISGDCDDDEPLNYPGNTEQCDGLDNDCDGTVDNPSEVLGEAASCAANDCWDILTARNTATDGEYWLDPDGGGAFLAYCDMTTDGGGWTMVGSFVNNDGTYNWTRYGNTNNMLNWNNDTTFGDLANYQTADYKSEAFARLPGFDLMAKDDGGGWASYNNALNGSLMATMNGYNSCQTTLLSGVTVRSSNPGVEQYGKLSFYGADPNAGDTCAFSTNSYVTDAAAISMAHQSCGTAGFGHMSYYDGSNYYDRDFDFCLQSDTYLIANIDSPTSCNSSYYGNVALFWFQPGYCNYATLYVR